MTAIKTTLHPSQQMVASSGGALLVSLFTTPFDVVKVRLQAQLKSNTVRCSVFNEIVDTLCFCTKPPAFNSPVLCTIGGNIQTVPRFSSTTDAFLKIARIEGIRNLWKGMSPTLIQMVPQTVIYFTAYDQLKVRFGHVEGQTGFGAPMLAGVTSRSFAVFAVSPIEMARTKFQSKKNLKYRQLFSIVIETVRAEGLLSMWRGIGPTLLRDVPFSALYWAGYETLKSLDHFRNFASAFVSGALAGMMAAALTTPFDVVKTFRQIELGEMKQNSMFKSKLPFTFSIIFKLYRTQGVASLFTGVYARLGKVAPACAIMISSYEYGKKYFEKKNYHALILENG